MLHLVRWRADYGRFGTLSGVFVLTQEERDRVAALCEAKAGAYFGSVLGKHSEVTYEFCQTDFNYLSDDQDFIGKLVGYVGGHHVSGLNPLDYEDEDESEEEEDA